MPGGVRSVKPKGYAMKDYVWRREVRGFGIEAKTIWTFYVEVELQPGGATHFAYAGTLTRKGPKQWQLSKLDHNFYMQRLSDLEMGERDAKNAAKLILTALI